MRRFLLRRKTPRKLWSGESSRERKQTVTCLLNVEIVDTVDGLNIFSGLLNFEVREVIIWQIATI